jgi:N-acylneuraminate cytidylyltransferase
MLKKEIPQPFEFIVSTDSEKIIKYLEKYKWISVKKRSRSLATDDSLDKLIKHVPEVCKGKFILWTHVTSPLFQHSDYIEFIKIFLKNYKKNKIKSAFSANKIQKFLFRKRDKQWLSHNRNKKKWPRTQDLADCYEVNSAAFISTREIYLKQKDRLCNNPLPIISKNNSGFDIDFMEDFNYLKEKLKKI